MEAEKPGCHPLKKNAQEDKQMALLTEKDRQYKTPEDICAHVGDEYADFHGAIVPPIFQNSLFLKPTANNGIESGGHFYTRVSNPTIDIAERKIAALEGADGALCFSSGMGAMSAAALYFIRANCHVVMVGTAYGPMRAFICRYLAEKFNVTVTLVDGGTEEIEAAIRPETTLIYLESPSSCIFAMQDIEAIAKIAKERGIGTVIDGTYATPIHQQPLKYGIDIVCHTASKYMGGHSDIVAGVVAARKEIIESMQKNERELIGACMDPHQAWLMIRGIRTMPVRLKQHGKSGRKVAAWLEKHEKVERVYYPGSETYDQKELFDKYLSGTNGLIALRVKGGFDAAMKLIDCVHLFQHGVSWGGFESLICYVGSGEKDDGLVRIHVGLEDVDTLIEDLEQALAQL